MKKSTFKRHGLTKLTFLLTVGLILSACKTTPVVKETPPPPPPKPVKTYKDISIGSNVFMTIPSKWKVVESPMPKGYVSYTIKSNDVHMVVSGYKQPKSQFSVAASKKELNSKTLLYWSASLSKQNNYNLLTDEQKVGGFTRYTCRTGGKCFQVFPLSNWRSVMAADLNVNNMKYNVTTGVDYLTNEHGNDVLKALKSIKAKSILLQP